MEIWKDIKDYEGLYQVSNKGNVRSLDRVIILKDRLGNDRPSLYKGKILKPLVEDKKRHNSKKRLLVTLSKESKTKKYYIHRLVASAFINNPLNKEQVNHIDGNPLNNNVNNLEWATNTENIRHAFENKLIKTEKEVIQMNKDTLEEIKVFKSESEACRAMGVGQGHIWRSMKRNGTCKGFKWKYK